jgi:hypothetical protein
METTPAPALEVEIVSQTFQMSPTVGKFAGALAKAQGMIAHAKADSNNPFFKSQYADLASVLDACREPLSTAEIARYQAPISLASGEVGVKTMLLHSSGEWVASIIWCKPKESTPQTLGLVISYLRRYALAAAVGIAQKDDDAEAAHGRDSGPSPAALKAAEKAAGKKLVEAGVADQRAAEKAALTGAKTPGKVVAFEVPDGQVPIFLFRNGAWEFSGGCEEIVSKDHHARVKILQKELGIPDDVWHEKLCLYYGKTSSTQLSDKEGLDLAGRLEAAKKVKIG